MVLVIAFTLVIGVLASSSLASAHLDICGQPSVDSKKSVWHALCDLQRQIDTIELTPGPPGPAGKDGITDVEVMEFKDVNLQLGDNSITVSCSSPEQTAMAYGSTFNILSSVPEGDDGWTLGFLCSLGSGCTTNIWLKCLSNMP